MPPDATRYFLSRLLSCDWTTDGRSVLTPQRHLPSVPTLTLTKSFFGTFSLAWSLHLATTPPVMPTTPDGLVSPDTSSVTLPLTEDHTPLARAPANIPTFITPSASSSIPPVWEHVIAVLMKLPSTTAEGQNLRSWVTYHSLTSLEDFLMWELDTLQYDAVTVCFPSRDTTQPNSLISLKPNSIRHLIMLRKYIHHLVQDSNISVL